MFEEYQRIKEEMELVYLHDRRPWMIGYSGGKDSTLLCQLVFEMLESLPKEKRWKPVYIVTSDTMVENPIVKAYMHKMSSAINAASKEKNLNVQAHMIYPDVRQTFWSRVIGLGYPTPEAPGFRWCTERLKIHPSNAFTYNTIKKDGEIVILLGVRKAESAARSRSISSREIEGKILTPHPQIPKAYVYSPLSEVRNENVWEYLLRNEGKSAWNTDNNYLYNLYQGGNLSEEDSVVGQVDKDDMKVTGNSRFGCWICTMVKEDKSLKNFIDCFREDGQRRMMRCFAGCMTRAAAKKNFVLTLSARRGESRRVWYGWGKLQRVMSLKNRRDQVPPLEFNQRRYFLIVFNLLLQQTEIPLEAICCIE